MQLLCFIGLQIINAFQKLKEICLPSLDAVLRAIYNDHLTGKEYTFTQEASDIYDELKKISTNNIHL